VSGRSQRWSPSEAVIAEASSSKRRVLQDLQFTRPPEASARLDHDELVHMPIPGAIAVLVPNLLLLVLLIASLIAWIVMRGRDRPVL